MKQQTESIRLKPPCEIISKYVLPAVRALIAKKLIETYGYIQADAAAKLGMAQSSMSRYFKSERGGKVDRIAEDIANNELADELILSKLCKICMSLRRDGEICKIHRESTSISSSCNLCLRL